MATAKFYSVPEITRTSQEYEVTRYLYQARRSMEGVPFEVPLAAGEELVGLAGRLPEELPPCFRAVQTEALSPVTGWETEHGKWEPTTMHVAGPGFGCRPSPYGALRGFTRTKLVFRPKDDSQSDHAMTMYNVIGWYDGKAYLEGELTFCHVYELPKVKGKDKVKAEQLRVSRWRATFGHQDPLDVTDYFNTEAIGNGVDGAKKRRRSGPDAESDVWSNFTRIYIKDSKVMYAACHHCGRMMKLKDGANCGTSSLLKHNKTCKVKQRLSETEAIAELELAMLG